MVVSLVEYDGDFTLFRVPFGLPKPDIGVPRFDPLALDVEWQRVADDIGLGEPEAPLRKLDPSLGWEALIGQKSGKLALAPCALGA